MPDGAPIYIILDNLSAHRGDKIRVWARVNRVELCFTPTYASWANPIEAHFGPLRTLSWPARTPQTMPWPPALCITTCAGATPTPATPTSSPPNAANAPAYAANANNDGATAPPR